MLWISTISSSSMFAAPLVYGRNETRIVKSPPEERASTMISTYDVVSVCLMTVQTIIALLLLIIEIKKNE